MSVCGGTRMTPPTHSQGRDWYVLGMKPLHISLAWLDKKTEKKRRLQVGLCYLHVLCFIKGVYGYVLSCAAENVRNEAGVYVQARSERSSINPTSVRTCRVKSHDRPIRLIIVLFFIRDTHSVSIRCLHNQHGRRLVSPIFFLIPYFHTLRCT
jgi:hypothetical protein